jgi:cobalt-zinc-cadmium efflux system outer membrane protein
MPDSDPVNGWVKLPASRVPGRRMSRMYRITRSAMRVFLIPRCFHNFAFLTIAMILVSGPCRAAAEHHETEVHFDPKLTLSSLLEATVDRQPGAVVLAAERGTAEAEAAYGKHWWPEAPEVGGFHMSDRTFDDTGAYENEVALSLPLWLPGEKRARAQLGEAASIASESGAREFRWRVSGILRKQIWTLMMARRQWELALEQEQNLAEVLHQVTLFTEAGDLSRADLLTTKQELAIWKAETMTLEAEYQDSVREYQSFTGSAHVPVDISEQLSEQTDIREDHPALRNALNHLARETAATEAARQENTVRPAVQVFWRGYGADRVSPGVNALGLGLAVPLGRSPQRGPEIARANEGLAVAQAELLETRRTLELNLHEARHMLKLTTMQLENSFTMIDAAEERHRLDKLAFELGEFSVREWLRRLSELKKIQRSHEMLLMQKEAAVASYNQAVGETL